MLEDVQEIGQLKARYCEAADGGWDRPTHDADTVASLFTADGVWNAGDFGSGEGREEIRAIFKAYQRIPLAFHHVGNPIIKVHGDSATGEWHMLGAFIVDDNQALWIGGIYCDEFERSAEGWKFKITVAFTGKNMHGFDLRGVPAE